VARLVPTILKSLFYLNYDRLNARIQRLFKILITNLNHTNVDTIFSYTTYLNMTNLRSGY
jgi:hypothetical protein